MADPIRIGQRFGQLTVIRLPRDSLGYVGDRVHVRCGCGQEEWPLVHELLNGTATQCNLCSARILRERECLRRRHAKRSPDSHGKPPPPPSGSAAGLARRLESQKLNARQVCERRRG